MNNLIMKIMDRFIIVVENNILRFIHTNSANIIDIFFWTILYNLSLIILFIMIMLVILIKLFEIIIIYRSKLTLLCL